VAGNQSLADIAVDAKGNVYVTGGEVRAPGNPDYVTIKFDPAGNALWTVYRDWGANDDARFLALDAEGNSYVAGASLRRTEGPEQIGHEDIATVKYAPDGKELWTTSFNVGGATNEVASALNVDGEGHVLVTGTAYGAFGDASAVTGAAYITVKYGPGGEQLWTSRHEGAEGVEAVARDAALDGSGSVYVSGTERGGGDERFRLVTVKLAPDGSERWFVGHAGIATGPLAVGRTGAIWVSGSDAAGQDYLTIRYVQSAMQPESADQGGG